MSCVKAVGTNELFANIFTSFMSVVNSECSIEVEDSNKMSDIPESHTLHSASGSANQRQDIRGQVTWFH